MENYNTQLFECIDNMREKRDIVIKKITTNNKERATLLENIAELQKRLTQVEDELVKYNTSRETYDQTIQETDTAYMRILESSQTLLHVLKTESEKFN